MARSSADAAEPEVTETEAAEPAAEVVAAEPEVGPDPQPEAVVEPENPLADLGFAPVKHHDGATSLSFGGVTYEADEAGVILVPLEAVDDLASLGFGLTV